MATGGKGDAAATEQPFAELLVLTPTDTVGIALRDIAVGEGVGYRGQVAVARDDVPAGHKLALADIPAGASVVKFGIDIGSTTQAIRAGEHVHVHNLESNRMRGDL